MGAAPLLAVEGLSVSFTSGERVVRAVRDVSFSIAAGETLAIVGESGSGKSVTALSVMRLIEREGGTIDSGTLRFRYPDGKVADLRALDDAALRAVRGRNISMIFQEPMSSLNPVFSIGDQIAETLTLHEGLSRRAALDAAVGLLERVRIPDAKRRLEQYPHELSGGMRQRVMIAMALACRPQLLIADEPTTALDVTIQAQILDLIRASQAELGMAVIFITHDMGVVAEMADRVVVMRDGQKVEENGAHELFAAPVHPYTRALLAAVPRLGSADRPPPVDANAPEILNVGGLTKRFAVKRGLLRRTVGHVHAAEDVSFALRRGETLGLVGESGCGKSTTGRALMRLMEPSAGSIHLAGRELIGLDRAQMRVARKDIQMIFQDPYASLNPRMNVLELVTEPLAIHRPDIGRAELRARAAALLKRVGLSEDHLERYPHQFSGGQRQRLVIARALCLEPKVIVADEPVSALDVSVQAQVIALLRQLQRELGLAYVFISHDMAVIERMSHRVAVMYAGEIVELGPTEIVLQAPRHDYTRQLLAAVPVADPSRRRPRGRAELVELPSPIRPVGYTPPASRLTEIAPGHYVRVAA